VSDITTGSELLLGIDVGSTNVKAAVFDVSGGCVALASAPMTTHVPRPGRAFYRADEIWERVVRAVKAALEQLPEERRRTIQSVAVASVGEAGIPLDAKGDPVHDVIAWFDTRSQPQAERLAQTIGRDELFAISGLSLQPIWSLCKILWLADEEPDAWAKTIRWLNVADYVAYRLCGVPATDFSLASRTHAFDLAGRVWHDGLLRAVGVSPDVFAPAVASGTRLDTVTRDAALATGLPTSAVVCSGGHDHVVGALGAGVTTPGHMLNSLGTAEAIFLPLDNAITDPRLGAEGYTQGCHVVPDRYYVFAGQYTTGASIAWANEVLGGDVPLETLLAEAASIPPGSHGVAFLPHLRLANPPVDDPRSRGAFVGLHTDTKRGALLRAVLEGLALESRQSLHGLVAHTGVPRPREAVAIGGVTRNDLLMRIRASAFNLPFIVADVPEATALGAAMLGGIGSGVYAHAADALAQVRVAGHRVEPVAADVAHYDRFYEGVYRQLYPAVREMSHAIADYLGEVETAISSPDGTVP